MWCSYIQFYTVMNNDYSSDKRWTFKIIYQKWYFYPLSTMEQLSSIGHQGGPQMSENGEKIKDLNFPHLNNTLKLSKNTDFENIDSSYSP